MRVLVTGGCSGLGAALVQGFTERGDDVLVCDIAVRGEDQHPPASGTEQPPPMSGGEGHRLHLDVRSGADWEAARDWVLSQWGGLDVLVNNAGVAGGGRVDVADIDEWQWMFEINVFGVAAGTRAFAPMLKEQGSGQIVNVASLAGLVHPAGMGAYNAAKAAVVAFTETTGHELAQYGVKACVVCPSYFQTDLMDAARGRDEAVRAVIGSMVARSPWTADDIAREVLAGMDRGEELILPDQAARQAYALKQGDRAAYDAVMRRQARKLSEQAG